MIITTATTVNRQHGNHHVRHIALKRCACLILLLVFFVHAAVISPSFQQQAQTIRQQHEQFMKRMQQKFTINKNTGAIDNNNEIEQDVLPEAKQSFDDTFFTKHSHYIGAGGLGYAIYSNVSIYVAQLNTKHNSNTHLFTLRKGLTHL